MIIVRTLLTKMAILLDSPPLVNQPTWTVFKPETFLLHSFSLSLME